MWALSLRPSRHPLLDIDTTIPGRFTAGWGIVNMGMEKWDMALKVVTSQTDSELRRKNAETELKYPLRELAANLIRIVRGAGDPDQLPDQLVQTLKFYEKHVKATGGVPKPKVVRKMLDPEEAMIEARPWTEITNPEEIEALNRSGMAERQEAEELMRKGGLQITASMLLGQHTQSIAGEHEMYRGHHLMHDALAVDSLHWRKWQKERDEEEKRARRRSKGKVVDPDEADVEQE